MYNIAIFDFAYDTDLIRICEIDHCKMDGKSRVMNKLHVLALKSLRLAADAASGNAV